MAAAGLVLGMTLASAGVVIGAMVRSPSVSAIGLVAGFLICERASRHW